MEIAKKFAICQEDNLRNNCRRLFIEHCYQIFIIFLKNRSLFFLKFMIKIFKKDIFKLLFYSLLAIHILNFGLNTQLNKENVKNI